MGYRYLHVFGIKGWQVIDTQSNYKIVATGTLEEMREKADSLNGIEVAHG